MFQKAGLCCEVGKLRNSRDCVRPHRESGQSQEKQDAGQFTGLHLLRKGRIGNCILIYKCTSLVFQHNFRISSFVGPYYIIRIMVLNTDFEVICGVIQSLITQLPSHIALG